MRQKGKKLCNAGKLRALLLFTQQTDRNCYLITSAEFIVIRNLQMKRPFCVAKVRTVSCPSTTLSPREGLWPDSSRAVKWFGEDADPRVTLGCERLWQAQPPCPSHSWERSGPAGRSRSSFGPFVAFLLGASGVLGALELLGAVLPGAWAPDRGSSS